MVWDLLATTIFEIAIFITNTTIWQHKMSTQFSNFCITIVKFHLWRPEVWVEVSKFCQQWWKRLAPGFLLRPLAALQAKLVAGIVSGINSGWWRRLFARLVRNYCSLMWTCLVFFSSFVDLNSNVCPQSAAVSIIGPGFHFICLILLIERRINLSASGILIFLSCIAVHIANSIAVFHSNVYTTKVCIMSNSNVTLVNLAVNSWPSLVGC
jgi:hypothetical protein